MQKKVSETGYMSKVDNSLIIKKGKWENGRNSAQET